MTRKMLITVALVTMSLSSLASAAKSNEDKALKLGIQAYIYGYPLITMDMTRQVMTNVAAPDSDTGRGPMGQFTNIRHYPDASYRDVTAPNADTLYSIAWLDLAKQPYVLHVPNENGRYYLMPLLNGWTDVFAAPGTRTTGTAEHDYVVVGPHWKGALPKGMTAFKSTTDMVWIIGRTYSSGTPEDYNIVHHIQDEYKVVPLSEFGKPYTPPVGEVNPNIDMKTPVRDQVNALDAMTFFKRLAELMKTNPPSKEDAPMVAKLAKIGLVPGKSFDTSKLDADVAKGLAQVVKPAQEKIMGHMKAAGVMKNGWEYSTMTGRYGTDYIQRAFVAALGLGANLLQDAIYPATRVDSTGKQLNGANHYILHFAKGKLPPVDGFWSLTMYNDQYFFVANPLNRYSISERNHLKTNKDGSVSLYIQTESPGKDKESNWLPAPQGDFNLMLRLYWPKQAVLHGQWRAPGVVRVNMPVVKK